MTDKSISESRPATRFPIRVVMERRRVSGNPWISENWKALGIAVGNGPEGAVSNPVQLVSGPDAAQFLWSGLVLELHADEAESYYHNLMVGTPGCYLVVRQREDGMPEPVLATLSFDAGQAYQEGDETVYSVPLPPELYRAAEAFVLEHYVPVKKIKRKRQNWKEVAHDRHQG